MLKKYIPHHHHHQQQQLGILLDLTAIAAGKNNVRIIPFPPKKVRQIKTPVIPCVSVVRRHQHVEGGGGGRGPLLDGDALAADGLKGKKSTNFMLAAKPRPRNGKSCCCCCCYF